MRAEKFLTAASGEFDQISPADVKNLVLELKMRQMRLEMQNEELQRAQETITQARDRYAGLYDFAPVGYFTLDRKGKIVEANLAGARLLGVERDLLVNRSSLRWVAPESRELCRSHYRKVFENLGPQTCEVKLRRRGGPPLYAALESLAVPAEAGVVLHCRTAMSDITLRKLAEIELKLKEQLLDGASDSIFLHDLEGQFIYANEAACRDRGYECEELLGKDIWALIPPDYAAIRGEILQDLLAQGEITFESVNVRKDGSMMPVEIHARIIDLGERRLILSVARDITDRKRAEAEIKLNEARLASLLRISQYPSTSIQELLNYALDEAIALTGSRIGYIYFYDETTQQFTLNTWSRDVLPACSVADPRTIYHLQETGLWGEAIRQARPIVVNDFQKPHPLKKGYPPGHAPLYNYLTVPIFFQDRIVAVAAVANKLTDYDAADVKQLTLMMEVVWKIVDRQRVAEALRLAASKWRTTFDAIGDAVGLMDQEGNIRQCNQAMADLVGKPFPEIIGHRCWEVVHDTSGPIADCPMVRLRQSHQREESVLQVGENWFKVAVDPILDATGNLTGAVHIVTDITRIKRTEERLLNSLGAAIQRQTEVTGLLEASRIVLSETSFEAAVEDIYTFCKSLTGAAAGYVALLTADGLEEQMIASDPGGLPEAVAAALPRLRREMKGEAHTLDRPVWHNDLAHSEWAGLLPAGPPGLDNVLFTPLQVEGKTVGVMGLFNRPGGFSEPDATLAAGFTEFAAIALATMRARQALRQSEEKYRLLVNQVPAVVFKGYADWSVDFFDQKVEALTGYSPEDFNTRKLKWKDLILPDDFIAGERKLIETWKVDKSYEWEYRIRKKDGEIRWIQDLVQIFTDSAGKLDYANGILFDITDRKQAEERLQRTSRALKALSACNQALVHATQEKGFLTDVCEVIVREGGYPLAWVGYAQKDQMKSVVPIASAGVEAELPEWIGLTWGDDERGQGPGGMAIKTGEIQVARNILHDPALAPWHEEWRRREVKAIIALPLIIEGQAIGILDISAQDPGAFDPEEVRLLEELAGGVAFGIWSLRTDKERQRAEAEVQQSLEKLHQALDGTVLAVAKTVEMRDPYTAGHQRQVAQLASAIAQEMGFSPERVEGMRVLGFLHDIGKIAIPAEILSKPGRLSPMEFMLIKDHPRVGYEIIKDIDFPFPLAEGILQHHERLDGSGYPQGISGTDIILEARILGVADVVEAMASHRPYRRSLGLNQALEEISRNRGILYDPEVVDICLKLFHAKGFLFSDQPH
jgi:PAS domain S-box-containing protein/putative nucleotidyltransferase with HDIG domain